MSKKFEQVCMNDENPKWGKCLKREDEIYKREHDIRTEFGRDYTRILHCLAYRRLKHKTQVFFNTKNDHICTRMEHVAHVESISYTIARTLGLNCELTKAIATAHDLGHAPFGHTGEDVIKDLLKKINFKNTFWHEKNGLRFVDKIELLETPNMELCNLNLTYAVRDGIISHCGEINENGLIPREKYIDLGEFKKPGQYNPFTWEGCIVKVSDKIAYLGRDIEDAIELDIISSQDLKTLREITSFYGTDKINTSIIIHDLIVDLVKNSSIKKGIMFSQDKLEMMNKIKDFNYKVIYKNSRLNYFKEYSELIINSIFNTLLNAYDYENTINELRYRSIHYNELMTGFASWLEKYCIIEFTKTNDTEKSLKNKKIYEKLQNRDLYIQAILDYIAGMTDNYAIKCFNELVSF